MKKLAYRIVNSIVIIPLTVIACIVMVGAGFKEIWSDGVYDSEFLFEGIW